MVGRGRYVIQTYYQFPLFIMLWYAPLHDLNHGFQNIKACLVPSEVHNVFMTAALAYFPFYRQLMLPRLSGNPIQIDRVSPLEPDGFLALLACYRKEAEPAFNSACIH